MRNIQALTEILGLVSRVMWVRGAWRAGFGQVEAGLPIRLPELCQDVGC